MRTKVIPIGNSRGIRIPKALIEELGLTGEVELQVDGCGLLIRPAEAPALNWADFAAGWEQEGGDGLLEGWDFPNKFDEEEWTWDEEL